jgi:hypothetical protein
MENELLTALENGDVLQIQESFDKIMLDKVGQRMNEKKKEIAKTLFNKTEE